RVAVGHIPGTAFPGAEGNVGVAGHRDMLFRGLRNIRKNDLIEFETLQGKYTYQVEQLRIVKPHQTEVLADGKQPELTLVTCYPFYYVGSAPDRFIVQAREISRPPTPIARSMPQHTPARVARAADIAPAPEKNEAPPPPSAPTAVRPVRTVRDERSDR